MAVFGPLVSRGSHASLLHLYCSNLYKFDPPLYFIAGGALTANSELLCCAAQYSGCYAPTLLSAPPYSATTILYFCYHVLLVMGETVIIRGAVSHPDAGRSALVAVCANVLLHSPLVLGGRRKSVCALGMMFRNYRRRR
jgi:hypothetical protein